MFCTALTMGVPSPAEFWELSEGLSITRAQDSWPPRSPVLGELLQWAQLPGLVSLSSTPILAQGSMDCPLSSAFPCLPGPSSSSNSQELTRGPATSENNLKPPLVSVCTNFLAQTWPQMPPPGSLPSLPPGQPPSSRGGSSGNTGKAPGISLPHGPGQAFLASKQKRNCMVVCLLSYNISVERHTLSALLNAAVLNIIYFTPLYTHLSQGEQVGTC